MKYLLSGIAVAVLAATPSVALAEEGKEDKIICKRDEAPRLGSNIRSRAKKTCMTEADWKELEAQKERAKRRIQDKMRGGPMPSPGGVGVGG